MVTSMYSPSLESGISVQLLIPMQQIKQNKKQTPKVQGNAKANGVSLKKGGTQTAAAPAAVGQSFQSYFHVESIKNGKGSFRNAIRVRGQDYLTTILKPTPSTDDVPGFVLSEVYLNPNELGETRLARFAGLYEKFLFTDFKLKYTPAVGSNVSGSVVITADRDIADVTPAASEAGLRKLISYEGAKSTPCWLPITVDVPLEQPDCGYYTSANSVEDRLAYQGQAYVASMIPVGVGAGVAIGTLWFEYDCLLFVPQLEDLEQRSMFRNSAVIPTLADALLPYNPTSGPSKIEAGAPVPIPTTINTRLELQEGVYRVLNSIVQNQAGQVQFGVPTLTSLLPQPANAPQPQVVTIDSGLANAVGSKAFQETLLNIPKGGARMLLAMAQIGGLAANAVSKMTVDRIEGPLESDAFLKYYGGLPL